MLHETVSAAGGKMPRMAKSKAYRWRGFGEQAKMSDKAWAKSKKNKARRRPGGQPQRIRPMTDKQRAYLHALCAKTGTTFDPSLSLKAASAEITRLKARVATAPKSEKLEQPEFV